MHVRVINHFNIFLLLFEILILIINTGPVVEVENLLTANILEHSDRLWFIHTQAQIYRERNSY